MLQSLPRAFQTVNFILQIVAQQVFESIRQFFQFIFQFYFFFCGRKFVAGRGILKGPKFSVQSHQNTFTTNITFCGWLDHCFFSGNISRFLLYKKNCQTIPTGILRVFPAAVNSILGCFLRHSIRILKISHCKSILSPCQRVEKNSITSIKSNCRMFCNSLRIESCFYTFEVIAEIWEDH